MAYGNNNGNAKQTVYETYATVFGDKKAYTFGMSNGKFRLAVASLIPNNGNPQWDFKNQQGITLFSNPFKSWNCCNKSNLFNKNYFCSSYCKKHWKSIWGILSWV